MQIFELEHRVETLVAENRQLQEEKIRADESLQNARALEEEVARLANINAQLSGKNAHLIEKNQTLTAGSAHVNQQLEELEQLRSQHQGLISGMEDVVRGEITLTTADRDAETERLRGELHAATEQIQTLQRQILTTKRADAPLTVRDEDYFDSACQQLCQHVQQWVLRFSEVSRTRACRLSTEIGDEKLEERLDNTILDGSDVDIYLADQVKRRDVFMSVVMNMIWEFVFTRYLFGMDREQRQKLKALEKILQEAGKQCAMFPMFD
jgi:chromosome segregation ATPase